MALIACPECGQTITSDATACLHCRASLDITAERVDYVTGERLGVTPRPAVHLAVRPFRYPSAIGLWLMVGGGIGVLLASVLPWTSGPGSGGALSGDAPIVLAFGIAMGLIGISARVTPNSFPRILVAMIGLAAIVVTWLDLADRPGELAVGAIFVFVGASLAIVGTLLREP